MIFKFIQSILYKIVKVMLLRRLCSPILMIYYWRNVSVNNALNFKKIITFDKVYLNIITIRIHKGLLSVKCSIFTFANIAR